jgi:hypothetical protein
MLLYVIICYWIGSYSAISDRHSSCGFTQRHVQRWPRLWPRLWHNLSEASLIRAKTTVLEADFDRRGMRWADGAMCWAMAAPWQCARQVKIVNVEADAAAVNITKKASSSQFHPVPCWLAADLRLTCMTQPNAPFGSLEHQWSTGKSWCWVQHATGRKPMSQHFRQMITDFRAKDGETWGKTVWLQSDCEARAEALTSIQNTVKRSPWC